MSSKNTVKIDASEMKREKKVKMMKHLTSVFTWVFMHEETKRDQLTSLDETGEQAE